MVLNRLDAVIQEILNSRNVPDTNQVLKSQMADNLRRRLFDRIHREILDALPAEKLAELEGLMHRPGLSERQVQALIMSSGIDVQRILAEAMRRFRVEYLGVDKETR